MVTSYYLYDTYKENILSANSGAAVTGTLTYKRSTTQYLLFAIIISTFTSGEQNILESTVKHSFTRKAHSVICGPFGNIKTRDFICIQALDGSLSFFDQKTFLFMYIFNDVIIPGPICYITNSDSFVICKSTWVIEIHR